MTRTKTAASRRFVLLYFLTAAGLTLWTAAAVLAPLLSARPGPIGSFLYLCFAPFCHQRPERSFLLDGRPLAACARCFGIYLGAWAGIAAYPLLRGFSAVRLPRLRTFLLLSTPIAADAAGNLLGLWSSGNVLRFLTGILWGSILPFYFLTGLGEWIAFRPRKT